jgi:hypothetical protein
MHLMFLSTMDAICCDLGNLLTPFRVAPGHPNKPLPKGLIDFEHGHHHLTKHLMNLSSSSSFWFSLNSSYDHKFYLSKRLGMSPQDYEYLLMALDLASIHK